MADNFQSPGGFVFGVQGFDWGEQRPKSITFMLDGTAKVCDQHGRPIKGSVGENGTPVFFATATHAQTIAALDADRIDWRKLSCAGWPQLPYIQLKSMGENLPPTPIDELRKIKDAALRKDALRIRREVDEARNKELQLTSEE